MVRRDPLFKGATRPAMALGVPLVPLAVVTGLVLLLAVWTQILIALFLLPLVLVMRAVARKDDQQFRLLGLKLWCQVLPHHCFTRRLWHSSAYSPLDFRKQP
jgi:type IV secretion system protein VirB3